jgi:tetratricopeptide (TPR) repeat protein
MVAQVSNPTPRTIRVYCPTHKVGFLTAANSTIECSSQNHTLARDFPNESFWEYCCDCQHYWPMDSVRGNTASDECPVCERSVARRVLCAHCKVVSVESDEPVKHKTYSISPGAAVSPACPGCLRRPAGSVLEHTCEEFAGSFATTRDICPFCDENLEPPPNFPCSVAEYIQKLPRSAVDVSFEANTGLLKETPYGECVLVPIRGESALSIVIPRATTLSSKQNYYNVYYELFNCENPAAGDVIILSPAVVETVPEGWQLKEPGSIEIKAAPSPTPSQITCAHCGTPAGSKHTFCKRCGTRLQSAPADDSVELAATSADSSDDAFLDDTQEPVAPQTAQPDTEAPDWASKVQGLQTKTILGVLGGVVAVAIVLSLIAVSSTNGNSVEKRLDAAITQRQLFSPSGDSAHDLYYQLKNSGATEETLRPYRDRLLPQLITPNYQLIDQFMVPGSDDPPLADWQTAYQSLQWASELKPDDSRLVSRLAYCEGRIAYLSKAEDQAIKSWTRAAGADKNWPLPINGIGLIYTARKDHRTARTYYLTAAQRDPNWAYPYNNIGTSYYMEHDYYNAKTYYQKAIQIAPRWARPHSWLGDIALKEKDYATAVQEFSLVLDANATGTKNMDLDKIRKQLELARQQTASQY